jgi:NADPH:quinone reductase-like Zn-dependent oxidoreductase
MKEYYLTGNGGVESLKLADKDIPKPGRGQVLIKMYAASINFRDLVVLSGDFHKYAKYQEKCVPLSDGAGEIVAIGEGVDEWQNGDRVAGCFFQSWSRGEMRSTDADSGLGGSVHGVLSQYRVFDRSGIVKIPDHLSFAEAATLPCAALTAWNGLFAIPKPLGPGQTVVLLGTGGVSVFAAQFAHAAGARVIMTSSSDEKLDRVKALGVSDCINYRETPEWGVEVQKLTQGRGADIIIETGGAGTIPQSILAARHGGTLSIIGVLTQGSIDPVPIMGKALTLRGIVVGSRDDFEDMNRSIEKSRLKPVIDTIYEFSDAESAYLKLQGAKHFGKIVITINN